MRSIIPRHWRKFIGDAAHLFTFVPYVTDRPVPVEEEQVIPDVYAALLEQEEIGALQIIRWPEIGEKRREKIVETEAVVIAEQKLLT